MSNVQKGDISNELAKIRLILKKIENEALESYNSGIPVDSSRLEALARGAREQLEPLIDRGLISKSLWDGTAYEIDVEFPKQDKKGQP